MRQTLRTAALMLALCCPVFAGQTSTPPVVDPPPPPPAASGEVDSTSEVGALAVIALDLLQSVLTLF